MSQKNKGGLFDEVVEGLSQEEVAALMVKRAKEQGEIFKRLDLGLLLALMECSGPEDFGRMVALTQGLFQGNDEERLPRRESEYKMTVMLREQVEEQLGLFGERVALEIKNGWEEALEEMKREIKRMEEEGYVSSD